MLLLATPRGDLVHDADATARRLGIVRGERSTDVMAAHGDLRAAYADPARERRALDGLAAWARRWSPLTRADGADGIALDVTGCTHLFGGETALLADMEARLQTLDLSVRLAMAPNHAAAHALARHAARAGAPVLTHEDCAERLAALPVAALRIDAPSVTLLRRLGLKTIGQVAALPRAALKKRFSARRRRDPRDDTWEDYLNRADDVSSDVLARVDEALGRVRLPLDPARPAVPPRVWRGLLEPVAEVSAVLALLRPMVEEMAGGLARRDEGLRVLRVEGYRADGGRAESVLRLSRPSRDVDHVMHLLIDRLDGWRAEFGFDALAVEALELQALPPVQGGLAESDRLERKRADAHALIDRLSVRLGADHVLRPLPVASHVPERAERWVPARDAHAVRRALAKAPAPAKARGEAGPQGGGAGATAARPDRLFDPPEEVGVLYALPEGPPARFTWRRVAHAVERVAGPERIAPEWWRERANVRARDYYRVETAEGRRFWLFREGFDGDERGGPPRWFIHGLFP